MIWYGTDEQRANLTKLADYLCNLPDDYQHFNMSYFVSECGTSACAVGHGPAAGIPLKKDDNWLTYSYENFCFSGAFWRYMFGSDWPNCPKAAAHRIWEVINREITHQEAVAAFVRQRAIALQAS